MLERGLMVRARTFGGALRTLRVWQDLENGGILLCSEESYREAVAEQWEPLYVGYPLADVVEVLPAPREEGNGGR